MNDRADGYVLEVNYTRGYYSALNPVHARFALLSAGFDVPAVGAACELGYGQGVSLAFHAAASPTRWFGTDLNPDHAAFARGLAAAAEVGVDLFDDSFETFAVRDDLPAFDMIGLHGVWSWISDRNRTIIVDFIRRRLKPGGLLYVGYNTLPGQTALLPVRHLLTEHAARAEAHGRSLTERIDEAIAFVEKLLVTQPNYARDNPTILDRFNAMKSESHRYLAHEYFNRDWRPMDFATLARWLAPATLHYACSGHFSDHLDALRFTAAQRRLLSEIADPVFRQTTQAFIVNERFRADYWLNAPRRLSEPERAAALRRQRVVAIVPRPEVDLRLRAVLKLGGADASMAAYDPIVALLAEGRVLSLAEIEAAVGSRGIALAAIVEVVLLLLGHEQIAVAQDAASAVLARRHTDRLNGHLIEGAAAGHGLGQLASPVTGGGIDIGRQQMLFLAARRAGHAGPDDWAREAARVLGPALGPADALADLALEARGFAAGMLPTLRALQIV